MSSGDCGQNAMLYFYGELDGRFAPEFEKHIAACSQCRRTLQLLKTLSGAAACARVSPPAAAVENVRNAVLGRKIANRYFLLFTGRLLRPAAAFAAAAVLVLGLEFFAGRRHVATISQWNDDISSCAERIASDIDGISAGMESQDVIGATDYDLAVVEGLMGANSSARR